MITVNPEVFSDIEMPRTICSLEAFQPAPKDESRFVRDFWWNWDYVDGIDPTLQENIDASGRRPTKDPPFEHTIARTETIDYLISLTVSNQDRSCFHTTVKPLTLYPLPTASLFVLESEIANCDPLTVNFRNVSNNSARPNSETGMTYLFNFGDGSLPVIRTDTSSVRYVYHNPSVINVMRQPTLTATNQWGCSFTTNPLTITVYPQVKAAFHLELDPNECSPRNVRIRNASVGHTEFYFWAKDEMFFGGERVNLPELWQGSFATSNNYEDENIAVTLRVSSAVGDMTCEDFDTQYIRVLAKPQARFTATPMLTTFPAGPFTLDNLIPPVESVHYNHLWSWNESMSGFPPNNFSTLINPLPLRLHEWGRFDVMQRVTHRGNGICRDSMVLTVNITPPAVIANFDDVSPQCAPYEVAFRNTSRYGVSFQWDFGDGHISAAQNPVHTFAEAGRYEVTLTAWGHSGDRDHRTKIIEVHPTPKPNFTVHPHFLFAGQPVRGYNYTSHLMPDGRQYDIWYEWDWGDGSALDTIRQPSHHYHKAGKYQVTLRVGTFTEPMCSDFFEYSPLIEVETSGSMNFPNTFRPMLPGAGGDIDRDGYGNPDSKVPPGGYLNYLFYPPVMSPTERYRMTIFNRAGIMIFETDQPDHGWNGYYRGRICEEGVYTFKVEGVFSTGESFSRTGDILLLW